MRYPLLATVTRAGSTGERRRRNPLTRSETAGVLRAARGAAQLAATSPAGGGPGVARAFWTGKAERGFEIAAGMLGAPSRGRRLRAWRAADPLRRTRGNPLVRTLYYGPAKIPVRVLGPDPFGPPGLYLVEHPAGGVGVARARRGKVISLTRAHGKVEHMPTIYRQAVGAYQARLRGNPVGRRLRVVIGHSGLARFMAQVEGPIGSVPREVPTPYAYGPTHVVWSWRGVPVVIAETRHRRHEVFRVEGPIGPVEEANPRRRRRRSLSVPEQHQLRIAVQTLRMPGPMAGVMGGPSKDEARRIVRRLTGRNPYTEVHADGDRVAYWRDPRRTQVTVVSRDTRPDTPRGNPRRRRAPARYCPQRLADPRAFDRRSFRTVAAKGHRVTVGCPTGQWDPRRRRCRTATRAQRVLHPTGEGRCPLGGRARRNPSAAAACALCRIEPRAPLSPYCVKCLRLFARGPRRNPARATTVTTVATSRTRRTTRTAGRARANPPRGGTVIYDRLVELRAVKGRRSQFSGKPFKHQFTSPAKVIGLPDGSVLLRGPKPLWTRVEVR